MEIPEAIFDKSNQIWNAPSVELTWNTDCALGRIIYNQLTNFSNATIQIDHSANVSLTKHEALIMAVRIAQHIDRMQLREEDIIGFAVKNTTYVLPTVIACLFNCVPFHPVNPILDQSTLEHCFGLTKPKVIFCDSDVYHKVYMATSAYKPQIITMLGEVLGVSKITDFLEPTKMERFYRPKQHRTGGDQTVAILCSSGTTGKPKAVCFSSSRLMTGAAYFTTESISFVPSSIEWITGLTSLIVTCLTSATRIIIDKPFNVDDFIMLLKKYRITNTFLAPRHIAALLNHPQATKELLSSLLLVHTGGSVLSEQIFKSFKALLNDSAIIKFYYGLTELGMIAYNMDATRVSSVGRLLPNLSLRIVDDNGKNLGHNELGEIWLNHGKYWEGYYGNLNETKQMRDAQGWFHTGDSGYMDDDNYLYVVDRKKEIRKYLGLHFWPKEIEEVITEMPGVKDACVITVPDETKGDTSGALVIRTENSSVTEQEVIEYIKTRLVNVHKQIHAGVFFVDEVPQNVNGKIMRVEGEKVFKAMAQRLSC